MFIDFPTNRVDLWQLLCHRTAWNIGMSVFTPHPIIILYAFHIKWNLYWVIYGGSHCWPVLVMLTLFFITLIHWPRTSDFPGLTIVSISVTHKLVSTTTTHHCHKSISNDSIASIVLSWQVYFSYFMLFKHMAGACVLEIAGASCSNSFLHRYVLY